MAKSEAVSDHGGSSRVQRSFLHLQGWLLQQRFFTSTLLPAMPRQLRWALRRAYFAPVDLMERFFGIVLTMMVVLMLLGFVLAHLAIAIFLLLAAGVVGRHLRRHGV